MTAAPISALSPTAPSPSTAIARTRTHRATRGRPAHSSGAARPGRSGAATYRRRRTAAVALAVVVGACGALGVHGVLTGPGDVPASAAGTGTALPAVAAVRAEPGDTLWSIANLHRGPVSMRRYLDALIDRNGGTTAIQAGQLVHLP